ncbi:hypothetical protein [Komagataeibacter swingsii]|nr:hypothetical protein [Komagataeibacter swingsii]AHI26756.1 hypothetical protein H845_2847 [Komagataeibacter xylinus E25]
MLAKRRTAPATRTGPPCRQGHPYGHLVKMPQGNGRLLQTAIKLQHKPDDQSGILVFIRFKISVIAHNHAVYFTAFQALDGNSFRHRFYCHFFLGNSILSGI